ncbi:putative RNA recognition motif domain, nucleotide-binding alpha-beta plait domain superfamily [Helianthus debilis subsp. tardiflorus]
MEMEKWCLLLAHLSGVKIRHVDMKHDFAFVDFSDPRDADVARYNLNGWDVDGSCIMEEHAKGVQSMFCTSLWQVAG